MAPDSHPYISKIVLILCKYQVLGLDRSRAVVFGMGDCFARLFIGIMPLCACANDEV